MYTQYYADYIKSANFNNHVLFQNCLAKEGTKYLRDLGRVGGIKRNA